MTTEEHVLVVPGQLFDQLGRFQGFSDQVDRYLPTLLDPIHGQYLPRSLMERDPSFKQLIPYVIFRHDSGNGQWMYFHYTRGRGQGEQRLHAKRSVGVGGHISVQDTQAGDAYAEGMRRELEEEVEFAPVKGGAEVSQVRIPADVGQRTPQAVNQGASAFGQIIGLINDDSNEVGQVHLGVVHLVELSAPEVRAREKDLVDARFSTPTELRQWFDEFETWSQIALRYLLGDEHSFAADEDRQKSATS